MPVSTVELKAAKEVKPLKPIQPTQLWGFDNALSLLKSYQDPYILDALDEFLLLNSKLLLNPLPFKRVTKSPNKEAKELSLRNILYSDITPNNIKDAETISNVLNLDYNDVLRVISQTCKRIPERKVYNYEKLKSKLPDDREKYLEEERILLYSSRVLRERRIVLRLVIELLNNKSNSETSSTIQNLGKEIYLSKTYTNDLINSLEELIKSVANRSFITGVSDSLDEIINTESLLLIIDQMKILTELLVQNPNIQQDTVNHWFKFMKSNNFIQSLGPCVSHNESFMLMQALVTVISILFLDLENNYGSESDSDKFMNNAEVLKSINNSITNPSNLNSVVMYSWSIILLRKSLLLEEYKDLPSSVAFTKEFSIQQMDDSINNLNMRCVQLGVFEDLAKLNNLLKFDNIYPAILTSVILSAMPLISFTPEIASSIESILKTAPNSVLEKFFDNEATANAIILSRTKFPVSLTPYLKLASINGNFAFNELEELKSYISVFKKQEFNNLYEIDDENTELVKLTQWIDVYPPYEVNKKLSLLLNVGTKAKILPSANEDEVLVTFLYKYNGWAFLGRVLQNVSKVFDSSDPEKVEFVINILNLLTKAVMDNSSDDAQTILKYMSAYTDDSDIVEVILRLFEQALHARKVDILESVVNFLTTSMPFLSFRIWPYLSKSSLLSNGGKEGLASIIFGAIEMVNGEYSFTVSLIKLADSLVQNCLTLQDDYPEKSKSAILDRIINHMILIFESFIHCRFNETYQKMEIGVLILDILSNILATVHGIDNENKSSNRIARIFSESSSRIIDSFLIAGTEFSRSALPILSMIESLSANMSLYEVSDISGFWYDNWIRCSLAFSQLIISIRSVLNLPPSAFERSLFTKLTLLVNTYSQYETLRKDILDLITTLTNGKWLTEPTPSLLSHLGRDHAQVLLHSLASDLENSFDDYKMKISLYDFICAVMDGNQEGLSVLFISGRDVFGDFTKSSNINPDDQKPISLLSILKKNVRDIKYYPNSVSLHLADAISLAFNSWTTARENDNDVEFVDELILKIQSPINKSPGTTEEYIAACYELKLVSKIAEILSSFLFTTKNEVCKKTIVKLLTSDDFIATMEKLFRINNYQPTLHSNLQINFENTFTGFELSQFTCSLLKRNRFGVSTVYSLVLMDRLFNNSPAWDQLREQVVASSINLQYLSAQASVAKSFGALLTAFCRRFPSALNSKFLNLVSHLLKINVSEGVPADFFADVFQGRIELAFFIEYTIYTTPDIKKDLNIVLEIIKGCSELLSASSMNFLKNLNEDSGNYRPLLRILYCSLNIVKDDSGMLIEYLSIFRDLFELIITKATKNLFIEIQNDVYLSRTEKNHVSNKMNGRLDDLMLILSILKVFVNMKSSPSLNYEMASLIDDNGTIKALLNLYSLSHLIEVNDEHIFAQLSLMFIQELMTIEVMAERLISSGMFLIIVQSKISSPIESGGVNTLISPHYHRIWTNGILPIFLTALSRLGPSIIPEVSLALQAFGKQIESCIESWSKDSSTIRITSSMISETSQILLLFKMLQSLNINDYLNQAAIARNIETASHTIDMQLLPGLETESKRDDFVECINNLLKHPKFLSSRILPCSPEEQRMVEGGDVTYRKFINNSIDEIRELKAFFNQ